MKQNFIIITSISIASLRLTPQLSDTFFPFYSTWFTADVVATVSIMPVNNLFLSTRSTPCEVYLLSVAKRPSLRETVT